MEEQKKRFMHSLGVAGGFTLVVWLVHLVQWFSPLDFTHWGILPHRVEGLWGILFSPFLHDQEDWGHIINNSPTLFLGLLMLFYFYPRVAHRTLLFIFLFSGMATWLLAGFFVEYKFSYHIGASGVVYGLVSFLFFSGLFRRNPRAMLLSAIMLFMYSGMVVGLFPDADGRVSWQGHVAGAVFGVLLAYSYRDVLEEGERREYAYLNESLRAGERPFLSPDTFEKTRKEREAGEPPEDYWTQDWA